MVKPGTQTSMLVRILAYTLIFAIDVTVLIFGLRGGQGSLLVLAFLFIAFLVAMRHVAEINKHAYDSLVRVGFVNAVALAGWVVDIVVVGVPARGSHASYLNLTSIVSLLAGIALSVAEVRGVPAVPDPWNDPVRTPRAVASLLAAAVWPLAVASCFPIAFGTFVESPPFGVLQVAIFSGLAYAISVVLRRLGRGAASVS